MKRTIILVVMTALLIAVLAGCGNMSMGFGNFEYKKVHIDTHSFSGCFTVEKWFDNSTGVEVKTKEVGSMFLSEGNYILLEGETACPFCWEVDE